jgi:glycosyltransferase involved in cell wall biosynthesis
MRVVAENPRTISAVIPAHNEEETLEKSVRLTCDSLRALGLDFEAIVVDDHSTDRTGAIADALAAGIPNVTAVHHDRNTGVGGAFRTGIGRATKEFVIFVPVDNPLEPRDIEAYLSRMAVCDIVVGSRAERVGYTPLAAFASFVYNRILVPLLFNIGISDVNWIQVYRRSLFADRIIEFKNDRIFFLVEILVLARRRQLIIAEVPAKMKKRMYGKPTCSRPSTMLLTLRDMLQFFREIRRRDSGR